MVGIIMSVTFTWDNPSKTQLRFIFDEVWQREDLANTVFLSRQLIEERGVVVDIIIDMSECESMPSNLSDLRDHLKSLDKKRVGVLVFITQNKYLEMVMKLLNQILHQHFTMYFTDSLPAARRIAKRVATTRESQILP